MKGAQALARSDRYGMTCLLLALVPGLFLWRLAASWLTGAGLFIDEAQYWDWSRHLAWGYFSKPPVLAALIRVSTALGGDGLAGVRWLLVLLWTLTPLVLWRLVWEMLRERSPHLSQHDRLLTGAWAAALASACLVFALIGEVATTDGPLLFFWSLLMWLFWRAQQAPQQILRWVLWGGVLALGILSKYTAVASVGSAVLLALWLRDARIWRGLLVAALVCALLLLPHLWWNHSHDWPTLRHTAELLTAKGTSDRQPPLSAAALYIVSQLVVVGPVVLVLCGRWLWQKRRMARSHEASGETNRGLRLSLPLWASLWAWPLWLVGGAQSLQGKGEMNWPAAATLGLCVMLALWRLGLKRPLHWRGPMTALLLGALVGGVVSLTGDWREHLGMKGQGPRWDLWSRARGWDAAFEAMVPLVQQNSDAVLVADERAVIAHSAYAWRRDGWRPMAWMSGDVPSHHYELLYPFKLQAPEWRGKPILFVASRDDAWSGELRQAYPKGQLLYSHPAPGRAMFLWRLEPR